MLTIDRARQWFTKAGFQDVCIKRIGPKWYRGVRRHGLIMGCSVTGVKREARPCPLGCPTTVFWSQGVYFMHALCFSGRVRVPYPTLSLAGNTEHGPACCASQLLGTAAMLCCHVCHELLAPSFA